MTATDVTDHALAGVRVLDLTHQIAGPSATLGLAMMGADVVKVVAPGARDSYDNLAFFLNNLSKRSIELDLKSDEGRRTLFELAAVADVCVENFGPGVADRLGITWEALSAVNPRLIFTQIKGFATGSPNAAFPAFDPVAQAYSGSTSVTGDAGGPPMKCGPDLADTGTGMVALSGILAALFQRTRTGRGQHVQLAMADQIATSLRIHYTWPIERGIATPRFGNEAPFLERVVPSHLYPCTPYGPNDFVHVHCGSDRQWERLARAIDREDLITDPRTATGPARSTHQEVVDDALGGWLGRHDKLTAMRLLGEAGVPAGAVRDTLEILGDEDMKARGILPTVRHERLGEVTAIGWPVQLSASPPVVGDPPLPGQHTAEVLADWLPAGD